MLNHSARKLLRTTLPILLLALCLLLLALTLAACTPETDIGNNTALSEQFMDHVMENDYTAAFSMVKATVTDADFRPYWQTMQITVDGAESYELEQIGWKINTANGVTDRTTAYRVYLDNGRTVLLRVMTREGIEGIAGIHFSDITDFLRETDAYVPTVNTVFTVVFVLVLAFTVWMFVDCLRRKTAYKWLWLLLIAFSVTITVTVGETSNFSFNVGLFCQPSTMEADPGLLAVVTKIVIPVGAILYLCLRKKFTIDPKQPDEEVPADPFAETETETAAEADGDQPAPAAEADVNEGGEES